MKPLLALAALVALTVMASACGSTHGGRASAPATVSESRLIENGTVRCTVTVRTTPVQAGHELGYARVRFTFHNLTKHKVDLPYEGGSAIVKSPDGTRYDPLWEVEHSIGGVYVPTPIAPGGTTNDKVYLPRVSWEGPLRITPSCGDSTLSPVTVAVTSPGLPRNAQAAVRSVVAATGHLLDHCRPQRPGVPVVGQVIPQRGSLRPFRARCSVTLRRKRGFYVAQVLVVTPPDLRGVRVLPTYYAAVHPDTPNRNTEDIAWEFVVTRSGATPIANFTGTTATRHRIWAPVGEDTSNTWCGGSEGQSNPHPNGRPAVGFLTSDCHSG